MRALRLAIPLLFVGRVAAAQEEPAPAPAEAPTPAPAEAPASPSAPTDGAARAPEAAASEPAPVRPWRYTGTLGVISLPRVLSVEALVRHRRSTDAKWDDFAFGLGFDYLPPGLASFGDNTKLSWMLVGAEGRWFPWRFLFAGARVGYMYTRCDSEKFGTAIDYVTSSFALFPKVGVLYTLASGLTFGADIGATIPLAASTSQHPEDASDSNARKVAKTFGMFVMPSLGLRIGYTL